jgi:hypothetical protein
VLVPLTVPAVVLVGLCLIRLRSRRGRMRSAWPMSSRLVLRCRRCGMVTCADPPCGHVGTVAYGPSVNAAAALLGSEGNVRPIPSMDA